MADDAVANVLSVSIEREGTTATVRLRGKLLAGMGGQLCAKVTPLIPECKRIVLDLGEVATMDSMGLGTMVRLYVSAKTGGCSLELAHLNKRVKELLGLTHLLGVFKIIGEQGGTIRY